MDYEAKLILGVSSSCSFSAKYSLYSFPFFCNGINYLLPDEHIKIVTLICPHFLEQLEILKDG